VSSRAALAACLVVVALGGPAHAVAAAPQGAQGEPPAVQPDTPLAAPSFAELLNEWTTAELRHRAELQGAKAAGKKREEWPADPAQVFYPRFELLARSGEGRAVAWMAEHLRVAFLFAERRAAGERLLDLVLGAGDAPWVADVLEPLRLLRRDLDQERLTGMLEALRAEGRALPLRMAAGLTLGTMLEAEEPERALALQEEACTLLVAPDAPGAPEALGRYLATLQRLASKGDETLRASALARLRTLGARWPGSGIESQTGDLLFRLEHLCLGCPAPDFESEDVDGNVFRLSDYRGKVTLIDFWGFW
jgi:hypothetical protein